MFGTVGYHRPVAYTVINGEVVVRDGRLVKIDEDLVVVKAQALVEKLNNR